jgi:hypothetical protein
MTTYIIVAIVLGMFAALLFVAFRYAQQSARDDEKRKAAEAAAAENQRMNEELQKNVSPDEMRKRLEEGTF